MAPRIDFHDLTFIGACGRTERLDRRGHFDGVAEAYDASRPGYPAQARLNDAHGQSHYLMVEPDGELELAAGAEVLIVRKKGHIFLAIPNPNPLLSQ